MKTLALLGITGATVLLLGCATGVSDTAGHDNYDATAHAHMMQSLDAAVCVIEPTSGNTAYGVIHFQETKQGVTVTAQIHGLAPNSRHAFHIHEYGDITGRDGKTTGGHYNPAGHPHALPDDPQRHAGDLGNLSADEQGDAEHQITLHNISIAGLGNPIIGRAVIIHAQVDDGGQPTGNAGSRIAQGVIGIAKPTD